MRDTPSSLLTFTLSNRLIGGSDISRVLVVDDEETIRLALSKFLRTRGYEVESAAGGPEALMALQQRKFDLMLCDVRMQGSSGLDLCLQLRERDPKRKVVMLSVYDDEQYLFQAFRVGAAGYLLKSISSEELVRQLEFVHSGETAIDPRMAARAVPLSRRSARRCWRGSSMLRCIRSRTCRATRTRRVLSSARRCRATHRPTRWCCGRVCRWRIFAPRAAGGSR